MLAHIQSFGQHYRNGYWKHSGTVQVSSISRACAYRFDMERFLAPATEATEMFMSPHGTVTNSPSQKTANWTTLHLTLEEKVFIQCAASIKRLVACPRNCIHRAYVYTAVAASPRRFLFLSFTSEGIHWDRLHTFGLFRCFLEFMVNMSFSLGSWWDRQPPAVPPPLNLLDIISFSTRCVQTQTYNHPIEILLILQN